MWLFTYNHTWFGYIQITTLNNKNTFGAPYTAYNINKLYLKISVWSPFNIENKWEGYEGLKLYFPKNDYDLAALLKTQKNIPQWCKILEESNCVTLGKF